MVGYNESIMIKAGSLSGGWDEALSDGCELMPGGDVLWPSPPRSKQGGLAGGWGA